MRLILILIILVCLTSLLCEAGRRRKKNKSKRRANKADMKSLRRRSSRLMAGKRMRNRMPLQSILIRQENGTVVAEDDATPDQLLAMTKSNKVGEMIFSGSPAYEKAARDRSETEGQKNSRRKKRMKSRPKSRNVLLKRGSKRKPKGGFLLKRVSKRKTRMKSRPRGAFLLKRGRKTKSRSSKKSKNSKFDIPKLVPLKKRPKRSRRSVASSASDELLAIETTTPKSVWDISFGRKLPYKIKNIWNEAEQEENPTKVESLKTILSQNPRGKFLALHYF